MELRVELTVTRRNGAIDLETHPLLDAVGRISGVELEVFLPPAGVAVLLVSGLPFAAKTRAQHVAVVELPGRVVLLTLPVLDLHRIPDRSDTRHAVAANTALLLNQGLAKLLLFVAAIVGVVAMRCPTMFRKARRLLAFRDRPHSSSPRKSSIVRALRTSASPAPSFSARLAASARASLSFLSATLFESFWTRS